MNILSKFGETVAELIAEKNLTPDSFSKAVKIDRSVVYKYLRKECIPTLQNLIAIADYFQCSADFLLGLITENPAAAYKNAEPFCLRFKQLLSENHLSRYRFRTNNSFAKQSIDDWYNGKRTPSVDNAVLIAKYFNCTLDYLLGRE